MSGWLRAAQGVDLREGEMVEVQVGPRRVVLALVESKLRAFAALCPHASAALVAGELRPTFVICPLHAYRFDLATGRCLKPRDGPRLRLFPVERRGDEVWVQIEQA